MRVGIVIWSYGIVMAAIFVLDAEADRTTLQRPCEQKCFQICTLLREMYSDPNIDCAFCSCREDVTHPSYQDSSQDCAFGSCNEDAPEPPPYEICECPPECPPGCTTQTVPESDCPRCDCKKEPEETKLRLKRSQDTIRCKLRKFANAYSALYLNSKGRVKCKDEDDDEKEEDEDEVQEGNKGDDNDRDNLPKYKNVRLTNCRLRQFVNAYQYTNLNQESKSNCNNDEEDLNDDDIDTDAGNKGSRNLELPKGCKIIKFYGAYQHKNLNLETRISCVDENEEDDEDEV